MKTSILILFIVLVLAAAWLLAASGDLLSGMPAVEGASQPGPTTGFGPILPGRVTPTPDPVGTVSATAEVVATASATDCTAVFPLEVIEAIEFGTTTATQLSASFGEPSSVGGRAPRMRFEEGPCVLLIALDLNVAREAELQDYGTLGWLLDTFGSPDAAGTAQGNLALPLAGSALLFYPEDGVTALLRADLVALRRDTPVASLFIRAPYELDRQVRRLKVEVADWQPPLR